ncbi:unnamed protein product [Hyaloperonospora brassicae]|uniref:FYVE zinc finger domain-containing protein n=1 Tax=Hyaloperonospora brassicae TaxID=162125 RepID=A0AAV0TPU6_HYABA|nr:unnamed protein product [Hyaloperonospora brassicae]
MQSQSVDSPTRLEQAVRTSEQLRKPSTRSSRRSYAVAMQLKADQVSQRAKRESRDLSKEVRLDQPMHPSRPQQPPRLSKAHRQRQERPRTHTKQSPEHLLTPRRALRLSQLHSQPFEKPMPLLPNAICPSLEGALDQSIGAETIDGSQGLVELSPARHREIMLCVHNSLTNVRTSRVPGDTSHASWKVKLHKKNVAYHIDETSATPGQTRCCSVGYTHAKVDELVDLCLPAEKDAMLQHNQILFDNVVNADVFSTLRGPTEERPGSSVYVRRLSFQTSRPWRSRETYAIVATDIMPQSDGSTVGYCLWEAIDDRDIEEAVKTTRLEQSTCFRSGFYFRQPGRTESTTEDLTQGQTEIVYMVGVGSGAWSTSRLALEKHGSGIHRLCSHFRNKYLDPSTFVVETQRGSKCSAKSCKGCAKRFHLLSTRVNCHACGHVVCRSCASKESDAQHVCVGCLKKAGLPVPASVKKTQRKDERQKHAPSATTTALGQSSIAVVYTDLYDNDGTDAAEWAISTVGVPVQLLRKAVCV